MNVASLGDLLSNTLNAASTSSVRTGDNDSSAIIATGHEDDGEDSSDDCEMIGETVPPPLASTPWSTSQGLIKRDGDPISNEKPFIQTVCVYKPNFYIKFRMNSWKHVYDYPDDYYIII